MIRGKALSEETHRVYHLIISYLIFILYETYKLTFIVISLLLSCLVSGKNIIIIFFLFYLPLPFPNSLSKNSSHIHKYLIKNEFDRHNNFSCFRNWMGTKFSKTGGGEPPPPPSQTATLEAGASPPPSLKRRPSIGKHFFSCARSSLFRLLCSKDSTSDRKTDV